LPIFYQAIVNLCSCTFPFLSPWEGFFSHTCLFFPRTCFISPFPRAFLQSLHLPVGPRTAPPLVAFWAKPQSIFFLHKIAKVFPPPPPPPPFHFPFPSGAVSDSFFSPPVTFSTFRPPVFSKFGQVPPPIAYLCARG